MLLNPEYGFIGPSHAINAQALFESNRWSRTLHEEFAQNMSKKTRCWRPKKSCIGLAFAKALEGDLPKIYCIIGKSSKEYYIYIYTHTYIQRYFPKIPRKMFTDYRSHYLQLIFHGFPSWCPRHLHEEVSSLTAMGPSVPRIGETQLHLVPHARGDASKILVGIVI